MRAETRHQLKQDRFSKATFEAAGNAAHWTVEHQSKVVAAVIAVADTFDAITTDRPYRKGLSKSQAIIEIQAHVNKQFNRKPADALIELFHKGEL